MNKIEFGHFVMALRTFYPKENILPNKQAVELWHRELQDIPYTVAEAGLRRWVSTNKWSPSIADIRSMATEVQHGSMPDWGEGWEQVLTAIRKYGMYNVPDAMESFDPITKKCVERLGFKNICMSENVATDRANFRMLYEQIVQRKQKEQQIALPLRQLIMGIQQKGEQHEGNKLLKEN